MNIKKAVVMRIKKICKERHLALNALANIAGVTPSTIYSLIDNSRKDVGIVTIKKICDGLEIDIIDFFNDDIFKKIEQEIK